MSARTKRSPPIWPLIVTVFPIINALPFIVSSAAIFTSSSDMYTSWFVLASVAESSPSAVSLIVASSEVSPSEFSVVREAPSSLVVVTVASSVPVVSDVTSVAKLKDVTKLKIVTKTSKIFKLFLDIVNCLSFHII